MHHVNKENVQSKTEYGDYLGKLCVRRCPYKTCRQLGEYVTAGWEEFILHCSLKAEGDHPALIFKGQCVYVLPAPL